MLAFREYKHISCLDVGIRVHKIPYSNDRYLKARVTYFNIHNGLTYQTITVKIYREDISLWKDITDDQGRLN